MSASIEDSLLLRARYLQLIGALQRTQECNPATLAALTRIVAVAELPSSGETHASKRSWPLKQSENAIRAVA